MRFLLFFIFLFCAVWRVLYFFVCFIYFVIFLFCLFLFFFGRFLLAEAFFKKGPKRLRCWMDHTYK
jgi:hypothetical protein